MPELAWQNAAPVGQLAGAALALYICGSSGVARRCNGGTRTRPDRRGENYSPRRRPVGLMQE
jgi:hypothetical protein